MYFNKVFILGNLTQDPEIKSLPSGQSVANFGMATNRVWTDKDGRKQDSTEFHTIVAYGRTAEIIGQYSKKGATLFVEGRLQTRTWTGQDGKKNYKTEIIADSIQLGPKSGSSGPSSSTNNASPSSFSRPSSTPSKPNNSRVQQQEESIPTVNVDDDFGSDEINLEEIPF